MTWADRRYDESSWEPRAHSAVVTKALIIACVLVWLLEQVLGAEGRAWFLYYFALSPGALLHRFFIWQPATYIFLHDTHRLFHLLFNMLCLGFVGPDVERVIGPRRFAHLFLWSGVAGGVAHCFFMPSSPVVGASASVMGVLVVFAMLYPDARFLFMFIFPMKAKHLVLLLMAIDLFQGVQGGSGIASFAHLGGAAFGFLFMRYPAFRSRGAGWKRLLPTRRPHAGSEDVNQQRVDEILEKISRDGMSSLTRRERKYLLKASEHYRQRSNPFHDA